MAEAKSAGARSAFLDRLTLDAKRVEAMAAGLDAIRKLKDPVGAVMASWRRPNGMRIERVRVPLGVVGVIYESRPNVTADAGALCLKAGNAVILRGGSESFRSARAIHAALVEGLAEAGLPTAAISLVPTRERAAVGMMLAGLDGAIDVIVPRGGKDLVERVQTEARVPVFAHLEGVCHVYVDGAAKLRDGQGDRAQRQDAPHRRMRGRRNPAGRSRRRNEVAQTACRRCSSMPAAKSAATPPCRRSIRRVKPASEADWSTEYLDAILTAGVVDGVDAAIAHIERYGSHHTDAIVTENRAAAEKFLREVDSAIVLHNASTQFADGGEFGFGGEIGIATGRLHARGPVGVEQLTSFKYRIRGNGQTRP